MRNTNLFIIYFIQRERNELMKGYFRMKYVSRQIVRFPCTGHT
jgi:hypothetical protein